MPGAGGRADVGGGAGAAEEGHVEGGEGQGEGEEEQVAHQEGQEAHDRLLRPSRSLSPSHRENQVLEAASRDLASFVD